MKKCYVCDNDLIETDLKLRDSDNLKVLKCKKCSLEVLSDFSHINENFYEEGYMVHKNFKPEIWLKASYNDNYRRFKHLKKIIKNKKLLDFGCGAGGFIELASTISDVVGLEKQKEMADFIKKRGFKIHSDIAEIKQEKFDIITMFHVLEHLNNPKETIFDLKNMLNKCGKLIIEVPNTNDALISLYDCKSFSKFTHWKCHLWGFNNKNLKNMLMQMGFKSVKIKKVQRYNFLNHLNWIINHEPGGHKNLIKYYSLIIDFLYTLFLKITSKTDTIIAICDI